jgi:hypothetical protein
MFERITQNKKTTISGAVIFATGVVLVLLDKASLTEFSAFIVAALGFLFSKDPKK